ncbi:MAG TPA: TetR/AcrR family transcriptional regulator [Pirellulaceae bacterium]|nr:TetR/AcrR family transcriptional regulator [Pirellulaceae bacterium]
MRVTAETKQATRQSILEAARKLFAEQGFDSATTRDIARAARIGVGTLFNYFPTKEAIAAALVGDAWSRAADAFAAAMLQPADPPASLEEDLFAHVAAILRKLKPFRKYLPAVLETSLSPAANASIDSQSLRQSHLEIVSQIVCRHGGDDALTPLALQLYWTLITGVLAFWAADSSPRQEDTLALLDQSLAMFVGWLTDSGRSRLPGGTSQGASSSAPGPTRQAGPTLATRG